VTGLAAGHGPTRGGPERHRSVRRGPDWRGALRLTSLVVVITVAGLSPACALRPEENDACKPGSMVTVPDGWSLMDTTKDDGPICPKDRSISMPLR
jgi:hypothetical protein